MKSRFGVHLTWFAVAGLMVTGALLQAVDQALAQTGAATAYSEGDVMHGWRLFHEKKCADCHAIWDQGARLGPDLGRIQVGPLSPSRLAGVMWNHIPKMLGRMEQTGHPPPSLTPDEMGDLFALIFFVRQLDPVGDAALGADVLRNKGCSECHTIGDPGDSVGPDLAKWGKYVNPIAWVQMMWEHAPMMEDAMRRANVEWPELEGDDLVNIVAYIRSAGISGEKAYLRPGSAARGERLFQEKQCGQCHPGTGPDLSYADLPPSVAAVAARMWNHWPSMMHVMREQSVSTQPVTAQELADIVAFTLALAETDPAGDVSQGKRLFVSKGCAQCHEAQTQEEEERGPPVAELSGQAGPVRMAASMWNHGEAMLEQMTQAGLAWPEFNGNEMADLLAYLRSLAAKESSSSDE